MNNYSNQYFNLNEGENNVQKKNNKNTILLLIFIILVLVLIALVLFYPNNTSNSENTQTNNTSNSENPQTNNTENNKGEEYKDADLVCDMYNKNVSEGDIIKEAHVYIYFNKDGYSTKVYAFATHELTEEKYNNAIDNLCKLDPNGCISGKYEVSENDFNYKIERNGNYTVISQYKFTGKGEVATDEKKQNTKNEFVYEGYSCK